MKAIIADYLAQATRNRLVFCHEQIEGLTFVNVGKVLAESLVKQDLRSPMIAYMAEEVLDEILSSTKVDDEIGSYVALDNIGVLFEPDLAFNLKSVIDSASTNKVVIIHSDGIIKSDRYYFLQEGDASFIDLHGLSYIEIY
jgi:hypothetical protein